MNRSIKILTGLLAAQVIIAALVFVPRLLPTQSPSEPLLGTLTAAQVADFTVQDNTGNSIELANQSGTWVLPQSEAYPADATKVSAFIDKLIGVKTDPLVTRTAASHKRLQVAADDFVRKIVLKLTDGSTRTLYLGSPSGAGATHVRLDGQDEVYLARGLSSFEAGVEAATWINTTYLAVPQTQIISASLQNAQGTFQFTKDATGQWVLAGLSASEPPAPNAVDLMLARLGSVTMIKPLGKTPKPEYGLDEPAAIVTVTVSDTAASKVETLTIGKKDADGNYPVIASTSSYYVSVSGFLLDQFVSATRDTFVAKPTPTPTAAPTATVEPTPAAPVTETVPITSTPPVTSSATITPTAP